MALREKQQHQGRFQFVATSDSVRYRLPVQTKKESYTLPPVAPPVPPRGSGTRFLVTFLVTLGVLALIGVIVWYTRFR